MKRLRITLAMPGRMPPLLAAVGLSLVAPPLAIGQEPLPSIHQISDLRPGDWTYQTLGHLISSNGCGAAIPNAPFREQRAIERHEAAALLHACLQRTTLVTDAMRRLIQDLEPDIALLKGKTDGLETVVAELEATRFSPSTKLSGQVSVVLGANGFGGSASGLVKANQQQVGATTVNYDLQLTLDTSFNGQDLLRTNLRAGNFGTTSFLGAGPSSLSTLEVAFQENLDDPNANGSDVVAIDRLFYQAPIGSGFTATVGGRVGQDDMLALWPSVYPAETVLDVFTVGGAPAAYNKNLGAGAGLWWQRDGFSLSANYVAALSNAAQPSQGGVGTDGAAGTGTVQMAYAQKQWAVATLWSRVQNGNDLIVYGTKFTLDSYSNAGITNSLGLSGYWQPTASGWVPSISAGWGLNTTTYADGVDATGLVHTSQSWSVALQWLNAFGPGHALGLAVGQPTYATGLNGGGSPDDGNLAGECWYKLQITDQIAITPALFVLSRPLGEATPSGRSFEQLGALVRTSFRF